MALPSSPPLFAELGSEPPSSPPLLPTAAFSASHPGPASRKRHLSEYDSLSSDPLFSDDTSGAEDVGEYGQPKRKRMIKGPWYTLGRKSQRGLAGSTHLHAGKTEKEAFRNVDSGVWMGSDGSDGSDGSEESVSASASAGVSANATETRDRAERAERAAIVQSTPDVIARRIVNDCVEHGREAVDLSDIGLFHLSGAITRPLHQLIRQTHLDLTRPPSEDEFTSLTPEIKLFLSRNHLSSLPGDLFRLENITVLSLRNNQLADLPPAVARLHKLKELNIAGNNIRCLPWELLDLLDCRTSHKMIHIRPNPLLEPTSISGLSSLAEVDPTAFSGTEEPVRWGDAHECYRHLREQYSRHVSLDTRSEMELRLKLGRMLRSQNYEHEACRVRGEVTHSREELIYLASSSVEYFDVDGASYRKPGTERDLSAVVPEARNDPPPTTSAVCSPSLFELALRRVQQYFSLDEIPNTLPDRVSTALHKAASNLDLGNETCSTCRRPFVVARAEWVEYWFAGFSSQPELTQETVLPFLRRTCSWACATPTDVGTIRC